MPRGHWIHSCGGVQSEAQDGDHHSLRTHTHTDIFAEPYIIHLIYRKYIYLYYTQAVTLQEGRAPRQGLGHQGTGRVTTRRSTGRRPDQPILPPTLERGAPPSCSLESKGVLVQGWGPLGGNKWGFLVTWGRPGTLKKSLKIKNHQGRLEGEGIPVSRELVSMLHPRVDREPHPGRRPGP